MHAPAPVTPRDLQAFVRRAAATLPVSHALECQYWGPPRYYADQRAHWHGHLGLHRAKGTTDAGKVYRSLASAPMLLWLAEAAGLYPETIIYAANGAIHAKRGHPECAAIRRVIPWERVEAAIMKAADPEPTGPDTQLALDL